MVVMGRSLGWDGLWCSKIPGLHHLSISAFHTPEIGENTVETASGSGIPYRPQAVPTATPSGNPDDPG